jgi:hypothetical protein
VDLPDTGPDYDWSKNWIEWKMSMHILRACLLMARKGSDLHSRVRSGMRKRLFGRGHGNAYARRGEAVWLRLRRSDTKVLADALAMFKAASRSDLISGRARCAMGRRRKQLLQWWNPCIIERLASLSEEETDDKG